MNIHEYQAKKLLQEAGLPVPEGLVADTHEKVLQSAQSLGEKVVVKVQIHAGGRGKAGGVRVCKNQSDVKAFAEKNLHKSLVTHQTGPEGQYVHQLYVEKPSDIAKEFYLSFVLNRATSKIMIIASAEGGMDIETLAEETPEKILRLSIDAACGIQGYHARDLAFAFGTPEKVKDIFSMLKKMYAFFMEKDVSLLEINPLVLTTGGEYILLDAKVSFDDNALFRHPDIESLRDERLEDKAEFEASKHELNYIRLDGTIGCMVNGAGLAMATMDIIKHFGQSPANFLDVGGSANEERVAKAFEIIMSDKSVQAILVNIFGGIMRCDIIAKGIIAAVEKTKLAVPLVVRLEGTNRDEGYKILADAKLNIETANSLEDAAQKIVKTVKKV